MQTRYWREFRDGRLLAGLSVRRLLQLLSSAVGWIAMKFFIHVFQRMKHIVLGDVLIFHLVDVAVVIFSEIF